MAQRDEGLDKLEAFNAAAAETRAVLQREAEKAAGLADDLDELDGRTDHEMRNLGQTAREFDARYGPVYEMAWAASHAAAFPITPATGWQLGTLVARSQRQGLIAAADGLEFAYEEFPRARVEAVRALEEAETAASEASRELAEALGAFADDVEPRADAVAERVAALRHLLAHHMGED
jgi:hypothetical protein